MDVSKGLFMFFFSCCNDEHFNTLIDPFWNIFFLFVFSYLHNGDWFRLAEHNNVYWAQYVYEFACVYDAGMLLIDVIECESNMLKLECC